MMNMRKCIAKGILCALLTVSISGAAVLESQAAAEIPVFTETQHLDLPRNTVTYWFSIPGTAELGSENSVHLHMEASDTLINERSSITLSINGVSLQTIHINDVMELQNGWWNLDIPKELLRVGDANEMTITTAQRSIEGDCADIDNPANWVNLLEDSYVSVDVLGYSEPSLAHLYSLFYDGLEEPNTISNQFILGNLDSTQINAMLKFSSAAGRAYRYKETVKSEVALSADSSWNNHVYIGLLGEIEGITDLAQDEGYLAVNNQQGNSLIIGGSNETGFNKAVNFVSNPLYLEQLDKEAQVVNTDTEEEVNLFSYKEDGFYTLSDFGYDFTNLAGAFHQQVSFSLEQPNGLQSGSNSYVEIHFRHSEALVADNSLLTVYINSEPLGSIQLSQSNADGGTIKVTIPEEALEDDTIELSIEVYNYLGKVDCSKDYYDTAWTVIESDSVVYFEPGEKGIEPDLTNFPVFPKNYEDYRNTVVLGLEENYSMEVLDLASEMAVRAGQNSNECFTWEVLVNGEVPSQLQDCNMIFIGENRSISLPEQVKDELVIVPNSDGSFEIEEGVSATNETLEKKTILQAVRSPWNYNRRIYVITYDGENTKALEDLLESKTSLNELSGAVAVLNEKGDITVLELSEEQTQSEAIPLSKERVMYLIEKYTGMSVWIWLIILVVVILAVLMIRKAVKKKGRFDSNADKMKKQKNMKDVRKEEEVPQEEEIDDHWEKELEGINKMLDNK